MEDFFGYKTPQSQPVIDVSSYMQPQTSGTGISTEIIPAYKDTSTSITVASHVLPASPSGKESFDVFNKAIKTSSSTSDKQISKNVDKSAIFNRRPTWFIGSVEDTVQVNYIFYIYSS